MSRNMYFKPKPFGNKQFGNMMMMMISSKVTIMMTTSSSSNDLIAFGFRIWGLWRPICSILQKTTPELVGIFTSDELYKLKSTYALHPNSVLEFRPRNKTKVNLSLTFPSCQKWRRCIYLNISSKTKCRSHLDLTKATLSKSDLEPHRTLFACLTRYITLLNNVGSQKLTIRF